MFLCLFSFNALAADTLTLKPYGDFFEYSESPQKVQDILITDADALTKTINENGIIYLAVNEENTKQIQVLCKETDFSSTVINLTDLSNESINSLLPDITGLENIKGEIIYLKAQKFVKINLRSNNDDDEYILTQYCTVADRKMYTLSFYTKDGVETDYIDKTFESFYSPDFLSAVETEDNLSGIRIVTIIGAVVLSSICVVLIVSILIDIFKRKKEVDEGQD